MAGLVVPSGSHIAFPRQIHPRPLARSGPRRGRPRSHGHRLRCRRPGWARAPPTSTHQGVRAGGHWRGPGKARVPTSRSGPRRSRFNVSTAATGMTRWGLPNNHRRNGKGFSPPLRVSPWARPAGPTCKRVGNVCWLQKGLAHINVRTLPSGSSSGTIAPGQGFPLPAPARGSGSPNPGGPAREAARQRCRCPAHICSLHRHEDSHAQFAALLRRQARITRHRPRPNGIAKIRCPLRGSAPGSRRPGAAFAAIEAKRKSFASPLVIC